MIQILKCVKNFRHSATRAHCEQIVQQRYNNFHARRKNLIIRQTSPPHPTHIISLCCIVYSTMFNVLSEYIMNLMYTQFNIIIIFILKILLLSDNSFSFFSMKIYSTVLLVLEITPKPNVFITNLKCPFEK